MKTDLNKKHLRKKILFIINPLSHKLKGINIEKKISQHLDCAKFDYQIFYTKYPYHAAEQAYKAISDIDIIAAVGGDGTVHEVGQALIHTKTILAIIPVGSGNGLARHLNIPLDMAQAIKILNFSNSINIDTVRINDRFFLNVAGIGFDAHVAWKFAHMSRRGFFSYAGIVLREFLRYRAQEHFITVDGIQKRGKAFIISFANSCQYGNHIVIAPQADLQDGYLNCVIIKPLPYHAIFEILYRLKKRTLHQSRYVETFFCKEIEIPQKGIKAHIDGEAILFQDPIKIAIEPNSLKILAPFAKGKK